MEDSDCLLASDIHESVANPASLDSHRFKPADGAPCPSVQRELKMITGHQEHLHVEKHNKFKM